MSFKDKVEDFLTKNTPCWHISYDQFNFRLKGLHPKNPEIDPNRIPMMHTVVKLLDEDQLYMVEEIQQNGLFHYDVDPTTFKIKLRERQQLSVESDYGNFTRIEFSNSLDLNNLDAGISILLEEKEFQVQLLSKSANDEISKFLKLDSNHKIRFYITEYNNPNRLIDTFIIPLEEFTEDGFFKRPYDASNLPEDISIYYNKIFEKINFEVK
jgi:hypothetical protein